MHITRSDKPSYRAIGTPSPVKSNSEVWILVLVLVVVVDQSEAFSPAKRVRLSRNYFVQLV